MSEEAVQTVLLLVRHKENRRLLLEHLQTLRPCHVGGFPAKVFCPGDEPALVVLEGEEHLAAPLDLVIADGLGLSPVRRDLVVRKAREAPLFLPVLLVTQDRELGLASSELWKAVDELVVLPIRRMELSARITVLLRARALSVHLDRRNQDLKAFVYLMAHDLRAPARGVEGLGEALLEDYGHALPEDGREMVRRMVGAARDMGQLMDVVLDFAKLEPEAPILTAVSLEEVIQDTLERIGPELKRSGGRVQVSPPPWPAVLGSSQLLVTVFQNLLLNALKYVSPGQAPRVALAWETSSALCRVSVQDNGIGIPEEKLEFIFSPFRRLHSTEEYPGIGLGLTAARRMVELMHGRLWAESRLGEGSIFYVELMRCPDVQSSRGG